jgi:periplasmic protein TonB
MITTNGTTSARLLVGVGALLAMGLPLHAQQAVQAPPTAATVAATPSAATAAPEKKAAAVVPPKVLTSWRAAIAAHLNQHKRYPGSGAGISTITFSVDRSGKVLSARLLRSSGNAALDAEAVAMARRASPLPKPPADIAGDNLSLTVPVRFSQTSAR